MRLQKENPTQNRMLTERAYEEIKPTIEFETAFSQSVSDGLREISEAVAPILRIFLGDLIKAGCSEAKPRIDPREAQPLEEQLEKILGFGARVFEIKMLTNLQTKLGLCYNIDRNFKFSKEIEKARELFVEKTCEDEEGMTNIGPVNSSDGKNPAKEN